MQGFIASFGAGASQKVHGFEGLARDEDKRNPVFLNDHATTKNRDQDDGSIKHHPDLALQPHGLGHLGVQQAKAVVQLG